MNIADAEARIQKALKHLDTLELPKTDINKALHEVRTELVNALELLHYSKKRSA